jgi:DNA-binding response OmpR family regulator
MKSETKSILVIDDDPHMLKLMEITLKREGYDVVLAIDGVVGISLLKETKPDLILLDIMMPKPDGFEVLERIRRESNVPVIMLTAIQEVDSVIKSLGLGADDYVRKPFRPAELIARVRTKLK